MPTVIIELTIIECRTPRPPQKMTLHASTHARRLFLLPHTPSHTSRRLCRHDISLRMVKGLPGRQAAKHDDMFLSISLFVHLPLSLLADEHIITSPPYSQVEHLYFA